MARLAGKRERRYSPSSSSAELVEELVSPELSPPEEDPEDEEESSEEVLLPELSLLSEFPLS